MISHTSEFPMDFSTNGADAAAATIDKPPRQTPEITALARQIQALVAQLHPEVTVERRHDERFAMPVLLQLTPLDADRQPLANGTIVVGKDISRCGMSFFHERPLAYRRAIVSLEHPEIGRFAAEIDINWCRFTRPGWYVSGGRLIRVVEPQSLPPLRIPA
jgi:hypothetical protein